MKSAQEIISSGLLESFVLGHLDPVDMEIVSGYIKKYPEVKEYVEELEPSLEALAMAHAQAPPQGSWENISTSIQDAASNRVQNNKSEFKSSSTIWRNIGIAAGILGILISSVFYRKNRDSSQELLAVRNALATQEERCTEQASQQEKYERYFTLVNHPDTRLYALSNSLGIYWNETTKQTAIAYDQLPTLSDAEDYQIWADVEGRMIDVGVITDDMQLTDLLHYIEHAESLNVTVEPKGGSEEPTVSKLVASIKV